MITSNKGDIGVDELGVTTILLEALSDNVAEDKNVCITVKYLY